MTSRFCDPVAPYPGWLRREYRLSRPVTEEDIASLLGNEDLYVRDTGSCPRKIIHKYGLVELNLIVGEPRIEAWINPESGAYASEYLDALIETRF